MALIDKKITAYANPVSNLPDHPSQEGWTAAALKAAFDANATGEIKTAINGIIDALLSIDDSNSGADNIGAAAIANLDGTTVQALLESLRNKLKSVVDGSSGADFVGATAISDLSGATVQALLESLKTYVDNYNTNHKKETSTDHDNRYYTKTDLIPWLRGGDTQIKEEVFTIINPNNGDGTFTYAAGEEVIIGTLTEAGEQVFTLRQGHYDIGYNRVELIIDDTLRRSAASGGVRELSETQIVLTQPEDAGREITIKYYERLGITAEYNIKLSETKPPKNDGRNMWFKIIR